MQSDGGEMEVRVFALALLLLRERIHVSQLSSLHSLEGLRVLQISASLLWEGRDVPHY